MGEKEKAQESFANAYNLFKEQNLQIPLAKTLLNITETYEKGSNDSIIINNYLEALKIYIAAGADVEASSVYNRLGLDKLDKKEYDRAYDYFKQGYDICKRYDDK